MSSDSFKGSDSYKAGESGGPSSDILVKVNDHDAHAQYLAQKILPGPNMSFTFLVDVDGNYSIQINGPGAGGTSFKQATFNEMTADSIGQIRQDGSISNGSSLGTRAFSWISPLAMTLQQMGASFRQVGGQPWRFVVYDENGILLASTARFTPVNGYNVVSLQNSVNILANQRIYVGFWSGDAGGNSRIELISGCLTDNTSPLIQRSDPNEAPASMATGLSQTAYRPWLTFGS